MASNSNSERTNVITMLCSKLERFTQPCFFTLHGRRAHLRVDGAAVAERLERAARVRALYMRARLS